MSIELRIEQLVIDEALLGGERPSLVRATIERELAQRLSQPSALETLRDIGAVDRLPVSMLAVARHPRDSLGHRIAAAVSDGLGVPLTALLPDRGRTLPRTQP